MRTRTRARVLDETSRDSPRRRGRGPVLRDITNSQRCRIVITTFRSRRFSHRAIRLSSAPYTALCVRLTFPNPPTQLKILRLRTIPVAREILGAEALCARHYTCRLQCVIQHRPFQASLKGKWVPLVGSGPKIWKRVTSSLMTDVPSRLLRFRESHFSLRSLNGFQAGNRQSNKLRQAKKRISGPREQHHTSFICGRRGFFYSIDGLLADSPKGDTHMVTYGRIDASQVHLQSTQTLYIYIYYTQNYFFIQTCFFRDGAESNKIHSGVYTTLHSNP